MVTRPEEGVRPVSTRSLLIKPVGAACNLRCAYCFYTPRAEMFASGEVMSAAVRGNIQAEALRCCGPDVTLCWQGGEPTLAGLDFYRQALEEQKRLTSGQGMINTLQTNGLLLDEAWASFLARNRVLVGLSLDGLPTFHDRYRRDAGGCGTGARVLDAAKRLLDAGAAVNVLCCVTAHTAARAREIYEAFLELGLRHMQFIPVVEADASGERQAEFSLTAAAYGAFLCDLWDAWLEDFTLSGPASHIRFFESFCRRSLGFMPLDCEMHPTCGLYAVVERDGSVFPCDFFVEPFWKLGNVQEGLDTVLCGRRALHFNELRLLRDAACNLCPWGHFCHGGCLKYRRVGMKLHTKTVLCEAYKMFFAHAEQDMPLIGETLCYAGHVAAP